MEARTGDRRGDVRFEIVGEHWGTLEIEQSLQLLNLGRGGVLVQSTFPPVIGRVYEARLTAGDATSSITARARHVTPTNGQSSGYRVGFEFVHLPAEARHRVERFVEVGAAEV